MMLSHLHPQGVRRGCTGLKPQQHTLRGKFLIVWIPAFAGMTWFFLMNYLA